MHELAGAPHWRNFADAVDWSADLRPALRCPSSPGKQARPQGMVEVPAHQAIPGFKLLGDRGQYLAVGANR